MDSEYGDRRETGGKKDLLRRKQTSGNDVLWLMDCGLDCAMARPKVDGAPDGRGFRAKRTVGETTEGRGPDALGSG